MGGIVGGVAASWERLLPASSQRVVTVYRVHGCRCALVWADSLRAAGFRVRVFEYETLEYVRGALRTPARLRGCHVGAYRNYFLEGHVSAAALQRLATQRPQGLGLATEGSLDAESIHLSIARDEKSQVLLIEQEGRMRAWF